MSYGAGNSYNRGYENVDDKGADFDYQSYQNGFVNGASTNADENGRGGSRLFGGFVDAVPSLFRVRRNSRHKEVADINDVLKDTIATNYGAEGTANQTLDTMVKQREQLKAAHRDGREVVSMTKLAKVQLMELRAKARKKVAKLWTIIIILGLLNAFLIWRMFNCRGTFFC
ncbi:hypothetical protein TrCOL_g6570 [Triparma columacea]|uniref:Uncharacterized protein n=1 Tax=Triparma columacea TaxID=722753 RepID=A0A9W7GJG8_9STRA|nr:hypothetical protein TrCOL_g6570 [Triparma columacea]